MKILPPRWLLAIEAVKRRGVPAHDLVDDSASELLHGRPLRTRHDRHDDVQSFAARETKERAKAQALETLFDQKSRSDNRVPSHVLGRIEVEYDDVGLVDMLRTRSPDVQLERADLHETEQRGQPVDHRVRLLVRLDRDPRDRVGNPDAGRAFDRSTVFRSPRDNAAA